jgi:hypothetical protein
MGDCPEHGLSVLSVHRGGAMTLRMLCAVPGCLLALAAFPAVAEPCAGTYVAHVPEIAARLELGHDGRFHYQLAYGALDEVAEGRWRWSDDHVVLASDPVTPPEIMLLSDAPLPGNRLQVDLDLPDGISLQYFNVVLEQKDGSIRGLQFAADGLDVALDPAKPAAALRIDLPVLSYSSANFPLAPGGHAMKLKFVPHDIGKAVLTDTPMTERGNTLVMERHERTIAFVREGKCAGP